MKMVPADSYVWRFDLQLIELFENETEVWPEWRSFVTGAGFAISKDLSKFSLLILLKNQDVNS